MLEGRAAICSGGLHEPLAHCLTAVAALDNRRAVWTVADFIGQAMRLAEYLPDAPYAMNLCENRYLFMLAFCAAIVKRQTNLLPQNRALATQQQLLHAYSGTYILHDGVQELASDASAFNINSFCLLGAPATEIPLVAFDHIAAIAFTSGSTGTPQANLKTWRTFVDSSEINARYMLPQGLRASLLATVPAQHMWGLETSVLLPLLGSACIGDSRPLFPQDIVSRLAALPAPRVLVSTPVHLRALIRSGLALPPVERVLCATAPLTKELAAEVEQAFGGELVEVYGCSEVGSMACRDPVRQEYWTLFDGLNFVDDAGVLTVQAEHLPCSVPMVDQLQRLSERSFALLGRSDDMLEVAGKRGSLQELNKVLLTAPGVVDGVVFMADASEQGVARPRALVVGDGKTKKQALLAHFATHLDPAFVPRPIYFVESLPREESGKLQQAKLRALWQSLHQVARRQSQSRIP